MFLKAAPTLQAKAIGQNNNARSRQIVTNLTWNVN